MVRVLDIRDRGVLAQENLVRQSFKRTLPSGDQRKRDRILMKVDKQIRSRSATTVLVVSCTARLAMFFQEQSLGLKAVQGKRMSAIAASAVHLWTRAGVLRVLQMRPVIAEARGFRWRMVGGRKGGRGLTRLGRYGRRSDKRRAVDDDCWWRISDLK